MRQSTFIYDSKCVPLVINRPQGGQIESLWDCDNVKQCLELGTEPLIQSLTVALRSCSVPLDKSLAVASRSHSVQRAFS